MKLTTKKTLGLLILIGGVIYSLSHKENKGQLSTSPISKEIVVTAKKEKVIPLLNEKGGQKKEALVKRNLHCQALKNVKKPHDVALALGLQVDGQKIHWKNYFGEKEDGTKVVIREEFDLKNKYYYFEEDEDGFPWPLKKKQARIREILKQMRANSSIVSSSTTYSYLGNGKQLVFEMDEQGAHHIEVNAKGVCI